MPTPAHPTIDYSGRFAHHELFLARLCLVGAAFSLLLALAYNWLGANRYDVGCAVVSCVACTTTPIAWHFTRGHKVIVHVGLALLTAMFTVLGLLGSVAYLPWLGWLVIVAFMLLGNRGGLQWLALISAAVLVVGAYLLTHEETVLLSQGPVAVRLLRVISIAPTLAITGYLFEQYRRHNITTLEQAVSARSRLLAHVSHEMRTPLNGILGLTEALQLDPRSAPLGDSLGLIRQSGETLLALINDLLDVARAEAGTVELALHVFDLTRLVERTVALHRARPEASAIQLETICPPQAWVRSDAVRLQQVLGNLVANALRHGGGPITVRLETRPQGELLEVTLSVSDHGPGLTEAQCEQLFQPFVQLDSRTAPGGSGLGLSISRGLAQRLGGDLSVRSSPGAGSTFTCALLLEAAAPVPEAVPFAPRQLRGTLLVVDDNAVNRRVAEALLSKLGLGVSTAASGEEALTWLAAHGVDLVLMDLQMPGLDGFQTSRQLRASGYAGPIIALTASAQPETSGECSGAGMDGCLVKPLRLEQALPVLERCLAGRATVLRAVGT
jgi:signal transduction histidine kinase/CheY-like chemotaxis protein